MRSDIVRLSDLSPADLDAWRRLAQAAVVPNPFAAPEFVVPAARGLGVDDVGLLLAREDDEWRACLPIRRLRSWRGVLGGCVAGWRHAYSFLGTPLVTGDDPEAPLATLLSRGIDERGCLALDWLDDDGPLAGPISAALAHAGRLVVIERIERASLHRRATDDYLEQTMSPHHRRELRRMRRRLQERVGELAVRDRSGERDAYEEFLALERSGWKGTAGTAMASDPGHAEFFREVCSAFAQAGRLQLLTLAGEEHTVAMKCNLIAGEVTYCFKIAFDEQLAQLSPGIQLEVANIECFHAGRGAWSDSCADPDNAMINRLWPGRRALRSVVVTRRARSGALPYAKWRAAAKARPLRSMIATRRRAGASTDR